MEIDASNRTSLINTLIKKYYYKKYLEIGVQDAITFNAIECDLKVGVDPAVKTTFQTTSDNFFKENKTVFDIIFIDGLHQCDQVYRDINNSLKFLSNYGTIVCHDCNPLQEKWQRHKLQGGTWTGCVWKAIVRFRSEREDIEIFTVDADYGMSVIRFGRNHIKLDLKGQELSFENLEKNRKEWLNLVSIEEANTLL